MRDMGILFRYIKRYTSISILLLGIILVCLPFAYEQIITIEYRRQNKERAEFGHPRAWNLSETVTGMWWCVIRDSNFPFQRNVCAGSGLTLVTLAIGLAMRDFRRRWAVNHSATIPDGNSESN
jgi:hypothetical protein